jgi:hypothetical protein
MRAEDLEDTRKKSWSNGHRDDLHKKRCTLGVVYDCEVENYCLTPILVIDDSCLFPVHQVESAALFTNHFY